MHLKTVIPMHYDTFPMLSGKVEDFVPMVKRGKVRVTVGIAGTGSRGQINNAQLELSNVDLSVQFTDMIRAERGFQANSRIITTSDEMLQDLVNLKR